MTTTAATALSQDDLGHVTTQLSALEQSMTDARRRIVKGELVDMAPIAQRTNLFCRDLDRLSPEERLGFAPRIGGLVTELDLLEAEVKRRRDALAAQAAQQPQKRR